MNVEACKRYMALFIGIGKNAAKVSDTVQKVFPTLKDEPTTVSEIIHRHHDNRCTAHGLHKVVPDKKG